MEKRVVIISVDGGVVDVEEKPDDVEVIIKDYDIEGIEEDDDRLMEDEEGEYINRVFG